jgi:hypothetical protein
MSDVYSVGLWGEPPGASTDAELERRRFDRPASGAARTRAVVGGALDWLTPNLIREGVMRVDSEAAAFSDLLTGQAVEPVLSIDEANERYGIEGALSFSEPVTERWAAHRYERTRRDIFRQDVISRASEGDALSDFGVSLAVGLIDPVNFVFPFGRINSLRAALPGLAAAEAGQALAPRIAARGAFGVIEGAAFSAALEPAMAGLANLGERDYGLDDSLINVLAGAGVGGIVNAAGGFFAPSAEAQAERASLPEAIRAASPEARASAALHAVQALSEGQPVRAAEVFQGRSAFASFADYDNAVAAVFERRAGDVPENALPAGIERGIARPQADGAVVRAEIARADETVTTAWGAALRARAGQDYILSDESGDRWVVRRDLFEATYERAEGGYRKRADQVVGFWVSPDQRAIRTLEGEVTAEPGDIVLVGALGEMWPVKRARFEQRYERLRAPRRPAPRDEAAVNADRLQPGDDAPVLQTDRRAEGRAEVEAALEAWVAPVFGEDAAPIARVIANGFDNLGAYYGESAKDVTDAIGLTLRRGASDDEVRAEAGRVLEQHSLRQVMSLSDDEAIAWYNANVEIRRPHDALVALWFKTEDSLARPNVRLTIGGDGTAITTFRGRHSADAWRRPNAKDVKKAAQIFSRLALAVRAYILLNKPERIVFMGATPAHERLYRTMLRLMDFPGYVSQEHEVTKAGGSKATDDVSPVRSAASWRSADVNFVIAREDVAIDAGRPVEAVGSRNRFAFPATDRVGTIEKTQTRVRIIRDGREVDPNRRAGGGADIGRSADGGGSDGVAGGDLGGAEGVRPSEGGVNQARSPAARVLYQRARATTAKERRELRRAIKRADAAVAQAERQGVAFAAAAACIAREGFGSAGHGLTELMAGLGGGLTLSIPVGLIASNAAADNVNPRDPDEWLRRIRAHAQATLPLDQFGMIDAPLTEGEDPALSDLDWSAPGRNDWTPPEPADAPGVVAGMNPEGFKAPPAPASFNDKPARAPDDTEALIQLFGPLLALDSEGAAR